MRAQNRRWGQRVVFYLFASFLCLLTISPSTLFAGSIKGWGDNVFGESTSPADINFIAIASGGNHSLALKSDGSIFAWGNNSSGQSTPPAGNNFIFIAAGYSHSLAVKFDGSMAGWGSK